MLQRLTRRQWLALGFAAGSSALAYAVFAEPYWIDLVRRDMPIRNLPPSLDGSTLVQLSDLHAGIRVPNGFLKHAFGLVNDMKPDLVAITGDFMSCKRDEEVVRVRRLMAHLKPGRLGTFACLGNHDYGDGWWNPKPADALAAGLADEGVTVLRNRRVEAAGLTIAGLDDLWGPNWSPYKAMSGLSPEAPAVVLCHNPDGLDAPGWCGYRGWVLSGHTHGGQIQPPFLPPPFVPVKNKRYLRGEVALEDGRRVYINRALGFILPLRFRARPEITVFTLTPA